MTDKEEEEGVEIHTREEAREFLNEKLREAGVEIPEERNYSEWVDGVYPADAEREDQEEN